MSIRCSYSCFRMCISIINVVFLEMLSFTYLKLTYNRLRCLKMKIQRSHKLLSLSKKGFSVSRNWFIKTRQPCYCDNVLPHPLSIISTIPLYVFACIYTSTALGVLMCMGILALTPSLFHVWYYRRWWWVTSSSELARYRIPLEMYTQVAPILTLVVIATLTIFNQRMRSESVCNVVLFKSHLNIARI